MTGRPASTVLSESRFLLWRLAAARFVIFAVTAIPRVFESSRYPSFTNKCNLDIGPRFRLVCLFNGKSLPGLAKKPQ
jgi:hypothetical protein